jgi:hypothetical protein
VEHAVIACFEASLQLKPDHLLADNNPIKETIQCNTTAARLLPQLTAAQQYRQHPRGAGYAGPGAGALPETISITI